LDPSKTLSCSRKSILKKIEKVSWQRQTKMSENIFGQRQEKIGVLTQKDFATLSENIFLFCFILFSTLQNTHL